MEKILAKVSLWILKSISQVDYDGLETEPKNVAEQ